MKWGSGAYSGGPSDGFLLQSLDTVRDLTGDRKADFVIDDILEVVVLRSRA